MVNVPILVMKIWISERVQHNGGADKRLRQERRTSFVRIDAQHV